MNMKMFWNTPGPASNETVTRKLSRGLSGEIRRRLHLDFLMFSYRVASTQIWTSKPECTSRRQWLLSFRSTCCRTSVAPITSRLPFFKHHVLNFLTTSLFSRASVWEELREKTFFKHLVNLFSKKSTWRHLVRRMRWFRMKAVAVTSKKRSLLIENLTVAVIPSRYNIPRVKILSNEWSLRTWVVELLLVNENLNFGIQRSNWQLRLQAMDQSLHVPVSCFSSMI